MLLSLLIPELIWPEPDDRDTLDGLACPALNTLLARSRLSRRPPQSLEATLSDRFGHPAGAPYAAFRLLGEAQSTLDAGEHRWICCDPVHLRFLQERLLLADSRNFELSLEDAQLFADALNAQLSDSGRFHVIDAERWYLQVSDALPLEDYDVPPLSAVAGRSIERVLAEASQAKGIRRLFNEIQMILHAHPLNLQREEAGQMAINSLWLWGAGGLPARRESAIDGVWSSTPLARGLALAAGVPAHPLARDAATLLAHAAPDTEHLVVLEDLLGPVQAENGEAYRHALAGLEARWFAPLQKALAAGKIDQLRIEAPTAYATLTWECTRSDLWKLWKRPQTLAALARNLAGN
jgi:hypothetical protein